MEKGKSKIWWIAGSIAALGVGFFIYLRSKSKSNTNKSQGNILTNIVNDAKQVVNDVTIGGLTHRRFPSNSYTSSYNVFSIILVENLESSFPYDLHKYKLDGIYYVDFILKEDSNLITRIALSSGTPKEPKTEFDEKCGYESSTYIQVYFIPKEDKNKWRKVKDTEHGNMGNTIGYENPYVYATEIFNPDPNAKYKYCGFKNFKSGLVSEITAISPFDNKLVPSADQEFSVNNIIKASGTMGEITLGQDKQVLLEYANKFKTALTDMCSKLQVYNRYPFDTASYFDGTQNRNSFDDIF